MPDYAAAAGIVFGEFRPQFSCLSMANVTCTCAIRQNCSHLLAAAHINANGTVDVGAESYDCFDGFNRHNKHGSSRKRRRQYGRHFVFCQRLPVKFHRVVIRSLGRLGHDGVFSIHICQRCDTCSPRRRHHCWLWRYLHMVSRPVRNILFGTGRSSRSAFGFDRGRSNQQRLYACPSSIPRIRERTTSVFLGLSTEQSCSHKNQRVCDADVRLHQHAE